MKVFALVLVLLLGACNGPAIVGPTNKSQTPDSVQAIEGCWQGWGGQTCKAVFDDGTTGYTVNNGYQNYICKGQGL